MKTIINYFKRKKQDRINRDGMRNYLRSEYPTEYYKMYERKTSFPPHYYR